MRLEVERVHWRPEEAELNEYHHFLEKEIWEQPALLRRIAAEGEAQASGLAGFLDAAKGLHFVACGTAYHAALAGRYLLATEAHLQAVTTHAHEFGTFAPLLSKGDAVLAFSQSGETIDVLDAMPRRARRGAQIGALVNVPRLDPLPRGRFLRHAGRRAGEVRAFDQDASWRSWPTC